MLSAAELLQTLFHSLGLGLELGQVRLKFGDHLGLAPVAAVEPAVSAVATAPAASAATTASPALGGAAALTSGLGLALRMAFAALAMMLMMVSFACLAVAHDQPLFRGLAERRSAMDSYSATNSPRCALVLRISATQVSRCSRPILVSS